MVVMMKMSRRVGVGDRAWEGAGLVVWKAGDERVRDWNVDDGEAGVGRSGAVVTPTKETDDRNREELDVEMVWWVSAAAEAVDVDVEEALIVVCKAGVSNLNTLEELPQQVGVAPPSQQ